MSDDYDSHNRTATRCAKLRAFSQRPSEVNDTRSGNKSAAYCKSRGEDKCGKCRRLHYVDAMENGICRECLMQGAK